jgi:hypothetical protein
MLLLMMHDAGVCRCCIVDTVIFLLLGTVEGVTHRTLHRIVHVLLQVQEWEWAHPQEEVLASR